MRTRTAVRVRTSTLLRSGTRSGFALTMQGQARWLHHVLLKLELVVQLRRTRRRFNMGRGDVYSGRVRKLLRARTLPSKLSALCGLCERTVTSTRGKNGGRPRVYGMKQQGPVSEAQSVLKPIETGAPSGHSAAAFADTSLVHPISMVLSTRMERTKPMNTSTTVRQALKPPVDVAVHSQTQTATFALG